MTHHLGLDAYFAGMSTLSAIPQALSLGDAVRNHFFAEINRAAEACPAATHTAVLRVLRRHISQPELLDHISCAGSDEHYARELLYSGPGYSVLAIIWRPGQMSPIHGHKAWCAFGLYKGELVETRFKACPSGTNPQCNLRVTGCRQLAAGNVSGENSDPHVYHRVANLGATSAVSIHVYGTPFARLGTDLNRIWPG